MPSYKIVDSDWLNKGLYDISTRIKEKSGINAALSFPDGMIDALSSVSGEPIIDNSLTDSLISRSIISIVNNTVSVVGLNAFRNCAKLATADFSNLTAIYGQSFSSCSSLRSLILRADTVCTLDNANAFSSTPIAAGNGYIYVPQSLIEDYKNATNWSTYAEQIKEIGENI